jgi:hypothetical protein
MRPWIVLACWMAAPASDARAADGVLGVYLLVGKAHVQVSPFPASDHPGDLRVTVERTPTPGRVSLRLESRGHACVLGASRSGSGVLELSTPASCLVEVREPDARGRVNALLRSGHGTLRDGRLTLDLRFDVSGNIATRVARTTFTMFQAEFTVPEGWTPTVPVRGTVTSGGSGARQGSM